MITAQDKKEFTSQPVPANWTKSKEAFTGDDIIDAYLHGKEAGKNEYVRILTTQLNDNIRTATSISEKLYSMAMDKNVSFKEIRLKADGITNFKSLFITDVNTFISDTFREVYTLARQLKNNVDNENFNIFFSFLPISDNLSEHCLIADGFFMKYDKK